MRNNIAIIHSKPPTGHTRNVRLFPVLFFSTLPCRFFSKSALLKRIHRCVCKTSETFFYIRADTINTPRPSIKTEQMILLLISTAHPAVYLLYVPFFPLNRSGISPKPTPELGWVGKREFLRSFSDSKSLILLGKRSVGMYYVRARG